MQDLTPFSPFSFPSHPHSSAFALSYAAIVHQLRRELEAVQNLTEALLTLAAEQGLANWEGWAGMRQGWILGEQGEARRGIARLQEGWALFATSGMQWGRSYCLGSLAECYRKVGQLADGLTALTDALDHVGQTQERFYEAELYRLRGELLLEQGQDKQSEGSATVGQSLAVARQQDAKSWELRATTSLARLWQSQAKTAEARDLLAPVYNWFTEGFDTADLKDAKTLLDQLS